MFSFGEFFKFNMVKSSADSTHTVEESTNTQNPNNVQIKPDVAPPIGIDLGTTFSCAAVYLDEAIRVIPNSQFGDHLTPSMIFYDPDGTDVSVGKFADEWGLEAKDNLIYDVKRMIGRKFDDIYIQGLIKNNEYNFKIVEAESGNAEIQIHQNQNIINKTPEEISSEVLKHLKNSATEFLGQEITEAVISVPAHFSNAQRKATKAAAELAGLTVLKLISEPVAAAIHYTLDKNTSNKTVLVFDFGGGTLDVSVIEIDNEKFKVKGVEGDSFLGGRDFDNLLLDYFLQKAEILTDDETDMRTKQENLLRLKKKCTKLKIALSVKQEATFKIDHFGRQSDSTLRLTMSRLDFEEKAKHLFDRAINLVTQCLKNLELNKDDIDIVVLAGGTTRIPKVRELLTTYFGEDKVKTDLNPDEAVAIGAAIQAAVIKKTKKELDKYKVTEVTPLSLGVETDGGLMMVLINKNTPLPAKSNNSKTVTVVNNQKSLHKRIFEGERKNCRYNTLLGTLKIEGLPRARAGDVKFNTVLSLNEDGILDVECNVESTSIKGKASITLQEHRLSEHQIRSTLEEAERHKQEDELFENLMYLRRKSRLYCQHVLYDINKIISSDDQQNITRECTNFIEFADATVDYKKMDELRNRFEAVKSFVDPIIKDIIKVDIQIPQ